jgi:hypothetical protein
MNPSQLASVLRRIASKLKHLKCLFFVGSEEEALAAIDARLKEMSDDEG